MGTGSFNVYVNAPLKELETKTPNNIHILAYADHITILQVSETNRDNNDDMQQLLKRCSE